jgi:AraC family transcriptional regulator of adaptative response / DNA-3-methyladenine glycosylase II
MSENIQHERPGTAILPGMELDSGLCYRALRTRDARFDGRFFTGVTSTGIYCRPVCPARTPRAANCVFFSCAAAAEEAGFRACHRCRPETAPGTPAWRGSSSTVSRALRMIQEGALDDGSIPELAARLGVGERHLRRLFAEHLGASPLAVAQTRRVHYAKQMIEETRLPMFEIALAAGFPNVRRFNEALRRSFDRTPSEIRRARQQPRPSRRRNQPGEGDGRPERNGTLALRLAYRAPLDWDDLLAYLRPRLIPGVEAISGRAYRRTVAWNGLAGVIEVAPDPRCTTAVRLRVPLAAGPHLARLADRTRALFDLDADPVAILAQLEGDPRLARSAQRHPGIRLPGCWDRFELAVRAVLGQQVTVTGATRLAGRLVRAFGRPLATAEEAASGAPPAWLFPRPEDLATADLTALGMPATRAETIRTLADRIAAGEPLLELAAGLEPAVARLTAIPGIGDWTAQYIAMRALREPDAFPAGDLGLRRALADRGSRPTAAAVARAAEAWRPWRAYAAMLLWRDATPETTQRRENS